MSDVMDSAAAEMVLEAVRAKLDAHLDAVDAVLVRYGQGRS